MRALQIPLAARRLDATTEVKVIWRVLSQASQARFRQDAIGVGLDPRFASPLDVDRIAQAWAWACVHARYTGPERRSQHSIAERIRTRTADRVAGGNEDASKR
jgi:hypothetical protein